MTPPGHSTLQKGLDASPSRSARRPRLPLQEGRPGSSIHDHDAQTAVSRQCSFQPAERSETLLMLGIAFTVKTMVILPVKFLTLILHISLCRAHLSSRLFREKTSALASPSIQFVSFHSWAMPTSDSCVSSMSLARICFWRGYPVVKWHDVPEISCRRSGCVTLAQIAQASTMRQAYERRASSRSSLSRLLGCLLGALSAVYSPQRINAEFGGAGSQQATSLRRFSAHSAWAEMLTMSPGRFVA